MTTQVDFAALLAKADAPPKEYPYPVQHGPLRWVDREHRCASKGCGSSTFCKVRGIPRCMMHSLRELNEIVIQLTEGGVNMEEETETVTDSESTDVKPDGEVVKESEHTEETTRTENDDEDES